MPLYQEPAVYVEEQPPLVSPLPAASTSVAGFVGPTLRGPLRPQLITSLGDFRRVFGGTLDRVTFTSAGRAHHYLPDAVTGFFRNRGQACWISRVVPAAATRASFALTDTGPATGGQSTQLLLGAPIGSGDAINPPMLYALQSGLAPNDAIQIGSGSDAETHTIAAIDTISTLSVGLGHIPLSSPLARTVAAGAGVDEVARAANAAKFAGGSNAVFDLTEDANEGVTRITVTTNAADGVIIGSAGGDFLEIGDDQRGAAYVQAIASEEIAPGTFRVTLADPMPHAITIPAVITALDLSGTAGSAGTMARDAAQGTTLLAVNDLGAAPNLRAPDVLIVLFDGPEVLAVGRIVDIGFLRLDWPVADPYLAGTRARKVTSDPFARIAAGGGSVTTFGVDDTTDLFAGQPVLVAGAGPVTISSVDTGASEITVAPALAAAPAAGDEVIPDFQLTADAGAGDQLIAVNSRFGLDPTGGRRQLVRVGAPGSETYAEISEVPGPRGVAPDAGVVLLAITLPEDYPAGTPVRVMTEPQIDVTAAIVQLVVDADPGTDQLPVTAGDQFDAGDLILVNTGAGPRIHRLAADFDDAIEPVQITLDAPLARAHPAGAPVVERDPVLIVEARDQGGGGNQLSVSIAREATGLVSTAEITAQPAADQIRLDLVNGVHPGTVLELIDPATGAVQGPPIWVAEVDATSGNLVTLGANLDPANLPAVGRSVRSVEYRLTVFDRIRVPAGQPAPINPIADSEVYSSLSLSSLHPRYAPRIIGEIGGTPDPITGLPVGASAYVRVSDAAPNPAAMLGVRAFATLTDILPSGQTRPARHPLLGGDDRVNLLNDIAYLGTVSNDPAARTGIEALRNARDCSMIACPGQTTVAVQARLIQQCEDLRDRFALLDLPREAISIQAAQAHRQFYDSSYAAMFYPWLRVLDLTPGAVGPVDIPPSGHMAGIYARTDIDRGVFKAPANEVVMGITDITEKLRGTEHGILNTDNTQINVIRQYRDRGTRLMGARTLSSDPSERYVNVRRFLIFASVTLERGLNSVIFEPNNRRLWARVSQSITSFLMGQYQAGALFGATPEAAFFVRCDETTMTEDDILNGRLIALVGVAVTRPAEFVIIRVQKEIVDMAG